MTAPLAVREREALDALAVALGALDRALNLCGAADFGSQVMGPLADAIEMAQFADKVARGAS